MTGGGAGGTIIIYFFDIYGYNGALSANGGDSADGCLGAEGSGGIIKLITLDKTSIHQYNYTNLTSSSTFYINVTVYPGKRNLPYAFQ